MTQIDDGGTAFPVYNQNARSQATGLTVRDWFAGMAMQGMIASADGEVNKPAMAKWCCQMADAMIEELKKGQ